MSVRNSVKMMLALTENDISYESHIYAYAPHGFSSCDSSLMLDNDEICTRVPHWVDDCIKWLKDVFGNFANQKMDEPKCKAYINGNHESYYNIECTIGYLMQSKDAMDIIMPFLTPMLESMHTEEVPKALCGWLLKELLGNMQIPQDTIQEVGEKHSKIAKCSIRDCIR